MADIRDLKSRGEQSPCGFDSRLGHLFFPKFYSTEPVLYSVNFRYPGVPATKSSGMNAGMVWSASNSMKRAELFV